MVEPEVVKEKIEQGLDGVTLVEIEDLTGTKDHYQALVVAESFSGKSRIERHQMIYKALGELMHGPVHALTLQTYTPQDWSNRNE